MKTILIAFAFLGSIWSYGEKTASIKVYGNCGMCKSRIEKSLKIEGVSKADWDSKTKLLTVSFDDEKTNLKEIEKIILEDMRYKSLDAFSLENHDLIAKPTLYQICQGKRDMKITTLMDLAKALKIASIL